jgi:acyl-CoA synthetase (AMP-forming)/AMP-acid ligase II
MAAVLDYPGLNHKKLMGHMEGWIMEGEVLPMSTVNHFNSLMSGTPVQLVNCYSSWEALDSAYGQLTDPAFFKSNTNSKFATCGLPMNEVQIYILDSERRLVKREQHGDVFIGSPAMFLGYLNDPVKTAERLLPNPYAGTHSDPAFGGPAYFHQANTYAAAAVVLCQRVLRSMGLMLDSTLAGSTPAAVRSSITVPCETCSI